MQIDSINPNKKDAKNFELLCNMAELTALFEQKSSVSEFLQDVVRMVAGHMHADVCSVYLYNDTHGELLLRATKGLNHSQDGSVRLKPGEGITGKSFEESRPIREGRASQNPFFKPIPGIEEEQYQAFLAVPIRRGVNRIGVLTLQDKRPNVFTSQDTRALKAIASQLASTLENAEVLIELYQGQDASLKTLTEVDGTSPSSGIAIGSALILRTRTASFRTLPIPPREANFEFSETHELTRFAHALSHTKTQLEQMQQALDNRVAEVADLIFSAHLLMLRDEKFSGAMQEKIQAGSTADEAVISVVNSYVELFGRQENIRVREKAQDILDLGYRMVRNLAKLEHVKGDYSGQIIIVPDIFPSEVVKLSAQNAAGLVALGSGHTAHVALLARSLKLPALFVSEESVLSIQTGTPLIIDGNQDRLYVGPGSDVITRYETALRNSMGSSTAVIEGCKKDCFTTDGVDIQVMANVNLIQDVELALSCHANGIGLYRSEFPFLVRNDFPSEEEQTRLYKRVVDPMGDYEVVIRTLDVGGDKLLGAHQQYREANPFLGFRGIRFSLANIDIFREQIRAILRAGQGHRLKIMFPMISSLDEYEAAKDEVFRAMDELSKDELEFNDAPQLGAMIELPAAVEIAGELAEKTDFLSVGTNDLIMYTLAVDRTNEHIGGMYKSHHPAVLRVLSRLFKNVGTSINHLSVCGEAANHPALTKFLIGSGIRKLSVDPNKIPTLKTYISEQNTAAVSTFAQDLQTLSSIRDIEAYLDEQGVPYNHV
ncbi:phosphoenolpyruvate--protein phosphotransferase [Spirochaeta lutea]|uniref:phosphoenolpyruvate--protein phosphotransferase n=1 Tax=Spirochaeta lutea TaxID=1480694 RepID=UPI0006912650|nr:phosphoenolpyruvate--protein phosphotransferase [Spirochaeta lutea]